MDLYFRGISGLTPKAQEKQTVGREREAGDGETLMTYKKILVVKDNVIKKGSRR